MCPHTFTLMHILHMHTHPYIIHTPKSPPRHTCIINIPQDMQTFMRTKTHKNIHAHVFSYSSYLPTFTSIHTKLQVCNHTHMWAYSYMVKKLPANAGNIRDVNSILGLGRPPEGDHGNSLQYSCLENHMNRGAWQATLQRVAKSWTQLK